MGWSAVCDCDIFWIFTKLPVVRTTKTLIGPVLCSGNLSSWAHCQTYLFCHAKAKKWILHECSLIIEFIQWVE